MVLGLRSKAKKSASVQVDYTIHFLEIKPWPPSQSLRSLRSVVLQWENGDRNTGTTPPATPSEGRIDFNESFKLRTALSKEASSKGNAAPFRKNVLELSLYEPRRDMTVKGQLLGSASVDLAEHGILKGPVTVGVPVSCKRSFRNATHPVLYLRIQPDDKEEGSTSSSVGSLSKEASMDRDVNESVSALMTVEYAEEADITPFTDDDEDGSSHSSLNHSSSALRGAAYTSIHSSPGKQADDENEPRDVKSGGVANVLVPESSPVKQELEPIVEASTPLRAAEVTQNESLPESSTTPKLSTNLESLYNGIPSVSDTLERSPKHVLQDTDSPGIHSTPVTREATKVESSESKIEGSVEKDGLLPEIQQMAPDDRVEKDVAENHVNKESGTGEIIDRVESLNNDIQKEKLDLASTAEAEPEVNEDEKPQYGRDVSDEVARSRVSLDMVAGNFEQKTIENGSGERVGKAIETECLTDDADNHSMESVAKVAHTPVINKHYLQSSSTKKTLPYDTTTFSQRILCEMGSGVLQSHGTKSMKSVRSTPDLGGIKYTTNDQCIEDVKEIDVQEDSHNAGISSVAEASNAERMSLNSDKVKEISRNNRSSISNSKVRELELKVEMLEGELREAAAIEIGLYCIVAEHGSSAHKVHTPARRLSRLYIHASKQWSRERKAAAAKSAVSGLFLAAKACGNDVPRLTFWLSNSIVLRAVIAQSIGHSDLRVSVDHYPASNGSEFTPKKKTSPLKWESPRKKDKFSFAEEIDDWEEPYTFMTALERIEAWIFSRIIESIWWQTLTPHMQMISEANESKVGSHLKKKIYGKTPSLGNQRQANSSIDIWKRAFSDAFERLCPVRAGGHECGCLPMLARLIMEQCVARLDVAMFNAILRESDDDIPTDPVSDPISDSKVLPIPSGRLSFGAGAQLKNAIGNWSRWLTDLFGMDVDDIARDENEQEDDGLYVAASFNSFRLLYALSDLLMLPKDTLLERTIRKEVCPVFGASVIKRILNSFVPDEFCPDPIPDALLEALDSEDPRESSQEGINNFPCDASPIIYSSPSIALIESYICDVPSASMLRRSGSSVVRKCHTSDDELDELDSPLASVIIEKSTPTAKPKRNGGGSVVRYQLLREVWKHDD